MTTQAEILAQYKAGNVFDGARYHKAHWELLKLGLSAESAHALLRRIKAARSRKPRRKTQKPIRLSGGFVDN